MFGLMPWSKRKTALLPRMDTPFGWMPEEFEKVFTRFLPVPEWGYPWGLTMEEREKEVVVRVELPGFAPEEVKVDLVGGLLKVEAEHKEPAEKGKEEAERRYVKREVTLPPELELEKLEAIYRNGVLELHVPRKAEAVARRIEVKT